MIFYILFIILIIFLILFGILYLYFQYKFLYWKWLKIPYNPPTFPYGNLPKKQRNHLKKEQNLGEYIRDYYFQYKNYQPFVGIYFFTTPHAIITDLNLTKNILIRDFHNFMDRGAYYNEIDDPLSAHIFNLGGNKWRILRNKLSPTFTSGKLKIMFPMILNIATNLLNTLNINIKNTSNYIEIRDLLARYTTDVVGTCAFGLECNCLKYPKTEFREKTKNVFEHPRHSEIIRQLIISFSNLARKLHIKSELTDASEFFLHIVNETVKYREINNVKCSDFMDLLIQLKNTGTIIGENKYIGKLSINEIAAQAYLFFVAGFDTSSSIMSLTLFELACNLEIQAKVRAEIQTVIKEYNNDITYDSLMEMRYLKNVISETLRKYPPVPFLLRETINDYPISGTNLTIESGVKCIIPALGYHHNPEIFPNPEQFNPDRFLPDEIAKRHPCAYLPFGDGPRICIGKRFAQTQSMVGLATILLNFQLNICDKTQIPIQMSPTSLVMMADHGIWLNVTKIQDD